jgi:hypothetical protein
MEAKSKWKPELLQTQNNKIKNNNKNTISKSFQSFDASRKLRDIKLTSFEVACNEL